MKISDGIKLDFSDVLIVPKRSTLNSRKDVVLSRTFTTRHKTSFTGIPIIASNMATGTFDMNRSLSKYQMFTAIAKHHNNEWDPLRREILDHAIYTIGMSNDELNTLMLFRDSLLEGDKDRLKICIDIANGYTQQFASFISRARSLFPKNVIIAGNVCTPEMTQELILAGADFVKIGIGPGSQCTTRLKTGVGYPQISACLECSDVAHGLDAGIILDGGMRSSGDIAKAFCANADMVMIGGLLAGTDECDGNVVSQWVLSQELVGPNHDTPIIKEHKYKMFYGMSSIYAQDKHFGGLKEYRTSEGTMTRMPYVGSVEPIVQDILGGLRSACTYIGASSIKNMGKCGSFVRVTHVHDKF